MAEDIKTDHYVDTFMGTDYNFDDIKNIGDLRSKLLYIAGDLPEVDDLEIAEFDLGDGQLSYLLVKGIVQ